MQKGRGGDLKGEANGRSTLTEAQVEKILTSPMTQKEIAEQFGTTIDVVSAIKARRKWAHVATSPVVNSKHGRFFKGGCLTADGLKLASDYARDRNITGLAREYEATKTTIRKALVLAGAELRSGDWKPSRSGGVQPKPIIINGQNYPSVRAAMKGEGLGYAAVVKGSGPAS
jgi:hypothetical protein